MGQLRKVARSYSAVAQTPTHVKGRYTTAATGALPHHRLPTETRSLLPAPCSQTEAPQTGRVDFPSVFHWYSLTLLLILPPLRRHPSLPFPSLRVPSPSRSLFSSRISNLGVPSLSPRRRRRRSPWPKATDNRPTNSSTTRQKNNTPDPFVRLLWRVGSESRHGGVRSFDANTTLNSCKGLSERKRERERGRLVLCRCRLYWEEGEPGYVICAWCIVRVLFYRMQRVCETRGSRTRTRTRPRRAPTPIPWSIASIVFVQREWNVGRPLRRGMPFAARRSRLLTRSFLRYGGCAFCIT